MNIPTRVEIFSTSAFPSFECDSREAEFELHDDGRMVLGVYTVSDQGSRLLEVETIWLSNDHLKMLREFLNAIIK